MCWMREKSNDYWLGVKAAGGGQHLLDQILMPAMHPVENADGNASFLHAQLKGAV